MAPADASAGRPRAPRVRVRDGSVVEVARIEGCVRNFEPGAKVRCQWESYSAADTVAPNSSSARGPSGTPSSHSTRVPRSVFETASSASGVSTRSTPGGISPGSGKPTSANASPAGLSTARPAWSKSCPTLPSNRRVRNPSARGGRRTPPRGRSRCRRPEREVTPRRSRVSAASRRIRDPRDRAGSWWRSRRARARQQANSASRKLTPGWARERSRLEDLVDLVGGINLALQPATMSRMRKRHPPRTRSRGRDRGRGPGRTARSPPRATGA